MKQVDTILSSAVSTPIEQLARALAPVIVVALTLQFLFYAMALARGHGSMTVTEFVWKACRVALIAGVATAGGFYQTTIADTMISLPDDMTAIVAGDTTVAKEIDKLRADASSVAENIEERNSSFSSFIPDSKQLIVALMAAGVEINAMLVSFVMAVLMVVVKVGMALIVATGPIFISALAFERTERLFDSWVSQALNFVFLALLAGLIFAILLQLNVSYVQMMGELVAQGDDRLFGLIAGQALVGLASVFVMIMIPGLAQSLSGGFGAQFGVGMATRGAMGSLRSYSTIKSLLRRR
ncbi:type IV secretion system protein [Alcaligenaceae bacterium]|nr:type IV secretion system protein [Alcaligenaceae bacterium]